MSHGSMPPKATGRRRGSRARDGLTTAEREQPFTTDPHLLELEREAAEQSPAQLSLFAAQEPIEAPGCISACRWCLAEFVATNPRRAFCGKSCQLRWNSRARYAPDDVDGYGARLRERRTCAACGAEFNPPPARQGAHPRTHCTTCRPSVERRR